MRNFWLSFYFLLVFPPAFSQFTPGQSYFSPDGHIEYIAGNMPLVLSAPHGGYLEPDSIPDRDCSGCSYVRDSYTQELSRELYEVIHAETGCYPHLVINRLHRKKLDANRDIGDAADGDPIGEIAWRAYQEFVDSAKASVNRQYQKGLFIDLHGHAHMIQRVELGYLLTATNLRQTDAQLNAPAMIAKSSIQSLYSNSPGNCTHAQFIRGAKSFGSKLFGAGFPTVPSANDTAPQVGESYFSGGFNTRRNGSSQGGAIDAIQIECNRDIRFDSTERKRFADSLGLALTAFIEDHYDENVRTNCKVTGLIETDSPVVSIFPNPTTAHLTISGAHAPNIITIFDYQGRLMVRKRMISTHQIIDISDLEEGLFYLRLQDGTTHSFIKIKP